MPESLPKAITEPLKVIAPMAAPRNSSSRLPAGIAKRAKPSTRYAPSGVLAPITAATGAGVMPKAQGSTTAATAMNTAAMPIMLWKKATNSGICVISTVLAR